MELALAEQVSDVSEAEFTEFGFRKSLSDAVVDKLRQWGETSDVVEMGVREF